MFNKTSRPCPACGNWFATEICEVPLRATDDHPLRDGYSVVACETCGTGFANVQDQSDFYLDYYRSRAKYATEDIDEWSRQRASDAADRLIQCGITDDMSIVDVGCGNGALVNELRGRGYQAEGIEIGDDIPSADVLCLTGVLEHVWDVQALLLLLLSRVVYVEVPDAASYNGPYLAAFEDFNTEHVNHFSADSLEWLGARFGFTSKTRHFHVEVAPGWPATYLSTLWTRKNRDSSLVRSLRRFAERSSQDMAEINAQLESALTETDRFALWGSGESAFKLLALPALQRRQLTIIVDTNKARHGLRLRGITVVDVSELVKSDDRIVIASQLRRDSIVRSMTELGVADRLVCLPTEHEMAA